MTEEDEKKRADGMQKAADKICDVFIATELGDDPDAMLSVIGALGGALIRQYADRKEALERFTYVARKVANESLGKSED